MPLDMKRQARIGAAQKIASEMGQDAATEHLPEEAEAPVAEEVPEEASSELSPEDAQKLSGLAALLK